MIGREKIQKLVDSYDKDKITIGVLGGHSALDVCRGAKKHGFRTLAVCQKGREKTYTKYYKTREEMSHSRLNIYFGVLTKGLQCQEDEC